VHKIQSSSHALEGSIYQVQSQIIRSTYHCVVLDGAIVIHFQLTKTVSTFNVYVDKIFVHW